MGRGMFIVVSDDREFCESARAFGNNLGATVQVYSNAEWQNKSQTGNSSPTFKQEGGAKILPFPGSANATASTGGVQTINELESIAIEKAIHEYNGNLTEAAKALGIGRATLYRKVKQYNIDPSAARKKRTQQQAA